MFLPAVCNKNVTFLNVLSGELTLASLLEVDSDKVTCLSADFKAGLKLCAFHFIEVLLVIT